MSLAACLTKEQITQSIARQETLLRASVLIEDQEIGQKTVNFMCNHSQSYMEWPPEGSQRRTEMKG